MVDSAVNICILMRILMLRIQEDVYVPNKTIYVSDDDLPLFERAQELSGANLKGDPSVDQSDLTGFALDPVAEHNRQILILTVVGATIGVIITLGLEIAEQHKLLWGTTADSVWGVLGVVSFGFLAVTAIWTSEYRFLLIGMVVSALAYQVVSAIKRFRGR